ncbi:MAG: TetR/AcrR family transcriptional regulator [Actinomycetota bacterium]|nr:TetR/AcrR family transcriptional regulator [Actinomycetota bacterium]
MSPASAISPRVVPNLSHGAGSFQLMAGDPLFDTLFRPTTLAPALASAAPVCAAGTRSRAGNAMARTRAALLDGARRAVQVNGTKITMAQVAASAGVAKATLYNHFRTRDAVLAALLIDQVDALTTECAGLSLPEALALAARTLAEHPVLRALAKLEPATLACLARVDLRCGGWSCAHAAVTGALTADGRGGADFVLRWLASFVISPAPGARVAADIEILLAGLPGLGESAEPASRWVAQPA